MGVYLKGRNEGLKHSWDQGSELGQNLFVINAHQKGGGCSKRSNSHVNVLICQAFFEDGVETVLVLQKLLIGQVALGLLFENVHGELLGNGVIALSPLNKERKQLLVIFLKHEHLGNEVSLSLEKWELLGLEVQGGQYRHFH
jgi:hypothetical protein